MPATRTAAAAAAESRKKELVRLRIRAALDKKGFTTAVLRDLLPPPPAAAEEEEGTGKQEAPPVATGASTTTAKRAVEQRQQRQQRIRDQHRMNNGGSDNDDKSNDERGGEGAAATAVTIIRCKCVLVEKTNVQTMSDVKYVLVILPRTSELNVPALGRCLSREEQRRRRQFAATATTTKTATGCERSGSGGGGDNGRDNDDRDDDDDTFEYELKLVSARDCLRVTGYPVDCVVPVGIRAPVQVVLSNDIVTVVRRRDEPTTTATICIAPAGHASLQLCLNFDEFLRLHGDDAIPILCGIVVTTEESSSDDASYYSASQEESSASSKAIAAAEEEPTAAPPPPEATAVATACGTAEAASLENTTINEKNCKGKNATTAGSNTAAAAAAAAEAARAAENHHVTNNVSPHHQSTGNSGSGSASRNNDSAVSEVGGSSTLASSSGAVAVLYGRKSRRYLIGSAVRTEFNTTRSIHNNNNNSNNDGKKGKSTTGILTTTTTTMTRAAAPRYSPSPTNDSNGSSNNNIRSSNNNIRSNSNSNSSSNSSSSSSNGSNGSNGSNNKNIKIGSKTNNKESGAPPGATKGNASASAAASGKSRRAARAPCTSPVPSPDLDLHLALVRTTASSVADQALNASGVISATSTLILATGTGGEQEAQQEGSGTTSKAATAAAAAAKTSAATTKTNAQKASSVLTADKQGGGLLGTAAAVELFEGPSAAVSQLASSVFESSGSVLAALVSEQPPNSPASRRPSQQHDLALHLALTNTVASSVEDQNLHPSFCDDATATSAASSNPALKMIAGEKKKNGGNNVVNGSASGGGGTGGGGGGGGKTKNAVTADAHATTTTSSTCSSTTTDTGRINASGNDENPLLLGPNTSKLRAIRARRDRALEALTSTSARVTASSSPPGAAAAGGAAATTTTTATSRSAARTSNNHQWSMFEASPLAALYRKKSQRYLIKENVRALRSNDKKSENSRDDDSSSAGGPNDPDNKVSNDKSTEELSEAQPASPRKSWNVFGTIEATREMNVFGSLPSISLSKTSDSAVSHSGSAASAKDSKDQQEETTTKTSMFGSLPSISLPKTNILSINGNSAKDGTGANQENSHNKQPKPPVGKSDHSNKDDNYSSGDDRVAAEAAGADLDVAANSGGDSKLDHRIRKAVADATVLDNGIQQTDRSTEQARLPESVAEGQSIDNDVDTNDRTNEPASAAAGAAALETASTANVDPQCAGGVIALSDDDGSTDGGLPNRGRAASGGSSSGEFPGSTKSNEHDEDENENDSSSRRRRSWNLLGMETPNVFGAVLPTFTTSSLAKTTTTTTTTTTNIQEEPSDDIPKASPTTASLSDRDDDDDDDCEIIDGDRVLAPVEGAVVDGSFEEQHDEPVSFSGTFAAAVAEDDAAAVTAMTTSAADTAAAASTAAAESSSRGPNTPKLTAMRARRDRALEALTSTSSRVVSSSSPVPAAVGAPGPTNSGVPATGDPRSSGDKNQQRFSAVNEETIESQEGGLQSTEASFAPPLDGVTSTIDDSTNSHSQQQQQHHHDASKESVIQRVQAALDKQGYTTAVLKDLQGEQGDSKSADTDNDVALCNCILMQKKELVQAAAADATSPRFVLVILHPQEDEVRVDKLAKSLFTLTGAAQSTNGGKRRHSFQDSFTAAFITTTNDDDDDDDELAFTSARDCLATTGYPMEFLTPFGMIPFPVQLVLSCTLVPHDVLCMPAGHVDLQLRVTVAEFLRKENVVLVDMKKQMSNEPLPEDAAVEDENSKNTVGVGVSREDTSRHGPHRNSFTISDQLNDAGVPDSHPRKWNVFGSADMFASLSSISFLPTTNMLMADTTAKDNAKSLDSNDSGPKSSATKSEPMTTVPSDHSTNGDSLNFGLGDAAEDASVPSAEASGGFYSESGSKPQPDAAPEAEGEPARQHEIPQQDGGEPCNAEKQPSGLDEDTQHEQASTENADLVRDGGATIAKQAVETEPEHVRGVEENGMSGVVPVVPEIATEGCDGKPSSAREADFAEPETADRTPHREDEEEATCDQPGSASNFDDESEVEPARNKKNFIAAMSASMPNVFGGSFAPLPTVHFPSIQRSAASKGVNGIIHHKNQASVIEEAPETGPEKQLAPLENTNAGIPDSEMDTGENGGSTMEAILDGLETEEAGPQDATRSRKSMAALSASLPNLFRHSFKALPAVLFPKAQTSGTNDKLEESHTENTAPEPPKPEPGMPVAQSRARDNREPSCSSVEAKLAAHVNAENEEEGMAETRLNVQTASVVMGSEHDDNSSQHESSGENNGEHESSTTGPGQQSAIPKSGNSSAVAGAGAVDDVEESSSSSMEAVLATLSNREVDKEEEEEASHDQPVSGIVQSKSIKPNASSEDRKACTAGAGNDAELSGPGKQVVVPEIDNASASTEKGSGNDGESSSSSMEALLASLVQCDDVEGHEEQGDETSDDDVVVEAEACSGEHLSNGKTPSESETSNVETQSGSETKAGNLSVPKGIACAVARGARNDDDSSSSSMKALLASLVECEPADEHEQGDAMMEHNQVVGENPCSSQQVSGGENQTKENHDESATCTVGAKSCVIPEDGNSGEVEAAARHEDESSSSSMEALLASLVECDVVEEDEEKCTEITESNREDFVGNKCSILKPKAYRLSAIPEDGYSTSVGGAGARDDAESSCSSMEAILAAQREGEVDEVDKEQSSQNGEQVSLVASCRGNSRPEDDSHKERKVSTTESESGPLKEVFIKENDPSKTAQETQAGSDAESSSPSMEELLASLTECEAVEADDNKGDEMAEPAHEVESEEDNSRSKQKPGQQRQNQSKACTTESDSDSSPEKNVLKGRNDSSGFAQETNAGSDAESSSSSMEELLGSLVECEAVEKEDENEKEMINTVARGVESEAHADEENQNGKAGASSKSESATGKQCVIPENGSPRIVQEKGVVSDAESSSSSMEALLASLVECEAEEEDTEEGDEATRVIVTSMEGPRRRIQKSGDGVNQAPDETVTAEPESAPAMQVATPDKDNSETSHEMHVGSDAESSSSSMEALLSSLVDYESVEEDNQEGDQVAEPVIVVARSEEKLASRKQKACEEFPNERQTVPECSKVQRPQFKPSGIAALKTNKRHRNEHTPTDIPTDSAGHRIDEVFQRDKQGAEMPASTATKKDLIGDSKPITTASSRVLLGAPTPQHPIASEPQPTDEDPSPSSPPAPVLHYAFLVTLQQMKQIHPDIQDEFVKTHCRVINDMLNSRPTMKSEQD